MSDDSTVLAGLADEFTARVRAGELPAIDDYAARHPELAGRIRALFPTLLLLEGMARDGREQPSAGVELTPGSRFGLYTIVSEIGRGGMGIVYEAIHETLRRRVALKVLPLAGPQAATRLERFLREARTAAGLHHTNIVPVFDVGQVNGVPYYAMQRIHGRGLDAVPREAASATIPTGQAFYRWVAELGVQAAEALAHAHQRGVVHRDIKPSNLLLDDEGVVWVTDFGLARSVGDASLTHTGQLLGTPRYMSPEQAGAALHPIDHRTDLYSLGATLYELLTRRPPVDGSTPQEVLQALLQREPVAPRRLDRHIPRDLETVVLKAMSRRPEDRYASAQALADDLRRFLDHRPLSARRISVVGHSVRWAKRNPVVTALTASLLFCVFAFFVISTEQALRAQSEAMRARAAEDQARHAMRQAVQARFDRDRQEGRRMIDQGLAYAARAELVPAVHWFARPLTEQVPLDASSETMIRQRLAAYERYGGLPRPLGVVATDRQEIVDLHPDGQTLLRRTAQPALEIVDVATGQVRKTLPTAGRAGLAAFLDAERIVAVSPGDDTLREAVLVVLGVADGMESLRLPLPVFPRQFHYIPKGKTVVLLDEACKELAICRLGDEKPEWKRQALGGNEPAEGMSSGPNGELYVVYRDHRVEAWDVQTMKKLAEDRWASMNRDFRVAPVTGLDRILTLEDGRGASGRACIWRMDSALPETEIDGLGRPTCLALRPDGRRLLAGGSLVVDAPEVGVLWGVVERRPIFRYPAGAPILDGQYLREGRRLILRDRLRTTLWDVPSARPDGTSLLGAKPGRVNRAFLTSDGRVILQRPDESGREPDHLDLLDAEGKVVGALRLPDHRHGWFTTRNGRFVATSSNDAATAVIHDAAGQVVASVKRPPVKDARVCLSEDGKILLRLAREQKQVELIDVPGGKVVHTFRLAGQDEVPQTDEFDLALSPDGRSAASLLDGRVQVWDVESGEERWTRVVPEAITLLFGPGESQPFGLVPGSTGGLVIEERTGVRFWDINLGQPLSPLLPGTAGYRVASWVGTGERAALIRGRSVVVWDALEGQPLTPALMHPEEVRAARLSPDGLSLTTVDAAGIRRTWDLSPDLTEAALLAEKLERLYGYRMDETGRVTPVDEPGRGASAP